MPARTTILPSHSAPASYLRESASNRNLATLRRRVAADLKDTKRLREIAIRCGRATWSIRKRAWTTFSKQLLKSHEPTKVTSNLDPKSDMLVLTSQRGFEKPFLNFFDK